MIQKFFSTLSKFPVHVKNSKFPVHVTNNAWKKIGNILYEQNAYCFHLNVKSGGCSGFSYEMKLLQSKNVIQSNNNIQSKNLLEDGNAKLYIDPGAEMLLLGTTIDYIEENFKEGVFENRFTFTPDKYFAIGCGCGVSFNPKN